MNPEVKEITRELFSNRSWRKARNIAKKLYWDERGKNIDPRRAERLSEMLGYPLIGQGKFRFVIDISGFAVKIPLEGAGFGDNKMEWDAWNKFPEDAKTYFAPCYGVNRGIAVFKKAEAARSWEDIKDEAARVLRLLEEKEIEVEDCNQAHSNWGIIDGKTVILDYSETTFWRDI